MATNLIRAESPSNAKQKPVRHGAKAQPCAELSEKDVFQKKTSNLYNKNQNYANPPAGGHHANPATPTNFVTASFSEAAAQANRSWADLTEDNKHESEDPFITVQRKKRRRGSAESPAAAAPSSGTRGAGATRRPRSSTGWAPRAEEVRTTQAHIAEARARQASSTEDHCVYVERSPELEPYHYIRAIDRMFGSTREVFQVTKMNGHFLVGLENKSMAERLVNEGLEVEGTLHRAFPFRKRAERITVGNLPFFVGDAAVISALSSFGRVTSIAPKMMKAGPYVYNDGRREAFIIFREGMTIERLPTRLDITIKGEAWPAYLSTGIRCSRCRGQGHRRANCPLLAGRTTEPGPATPSSTTSVPPATAPKLPQQPSAQPPPLASHSPAMEVSDVPPASRAALLPPAALRPSPPAPLASPAEAAPPAPPPVTPAPSLRTPGSREPAAPTPDIEMSNVEESPPPLSPPEPAAVPPTPPLPAPQPAEPIPPAPDEEEMTPIMREDCMVIEILRKLKHLTCLRPLYQSGIQPNDFKDAILFIDERESLMARLTPAMRGVLAEFLSAAIEPARGNHPDFIPDYARLRTPLNNLLKRDVTWVWDDKCQKAFTSLKESLTTHPISHLYQEGLPCQVYCDASTLGIAGVHKQLHPHGKTYPVQYFSRSLRSHERNYSISELECLAIVESVDKFRVYLMDRKFTQFSNHHALQWLKTIKNPSDRLFRWRLRLSRYEYEVRYIKGEQQYEANIISRNPFCGFLDAPLIKSHQPSPSGDSTLTIDHNGVHTISRKGVTKIIIPKTFINELLQSVHTQCNHPGISQMTRLISAQYYWQDMSQDIAQK
ncbi:hypothetical protein LAZ67_16002367, partial [Cordylochernes scorpioides]